MRAHLSAIGCNGQEISQAHLAAIRCDGLITRHTMFHSLGPDECVALFPGPRPAFRNTGNEEAGEREHVLGVSTCPVSTISKWLTVSKWWTIPVDVK